MGKEVKDLEEAINQGTVSFIKPYRPEGWENPYGDEVYQEREEDGSFSLTFLRVIYEAGADAMLKALRAEALMYRHGDANSFVSGSQTIRFDQGDRGHLVFIPEVE